MTNYGSTIGINANDGTFTVKDFTQEVNLWEIWLSAKYEYITDSIMHENKSGLSVKYNIYLSIKKPFDGNIAPSFPLFEELATTAINGQITLPDSYSSFKGNLIKRSSEQTA